MNYNFVHLSDIHFTPGEFDLRPAFRPFLVDLSAQLENLEGDTYLILSGDIAGAGSRKGDFSSFFEKLDPLLSGLGLSKAKRICVPGNHDISREVVKDHIFDHESLVAMQLNESSFNSYLSRHNAMFAQKFENYVSFEKQFAAFGVASGCVGGAGHSISDDAGVYCANSAFFSSGGVEFDGKKVSDYERLAVGTRSLQNWLQTSTHRLRIFVSHHPLNWLLPWCQLELKNILRSFDLSFLGHEHDQDTKEEVRSYARTLVLNAPALLTDKRAPMGYSITTIRLDGSKSVLYRQWDGRARFVLGTLLSGTDSGRVEFQKSAGSISSDSGEIAKRYFSDGLSRALKSFDRERGARWVAPEICDRPETDRAKSSRTKITIDDIIESSESMIISAPPQYGLSSIGWQLCLVGTKNDSLWLRVDLAVTKQHDVRQAISALLSTFGGDKSQVRGIVIDSWRVDLKNGEKCIRAISRDYPAARLIVLETDISPRFGSSLISIEGRNFKSTYLWALKRQALRGIVTDYCEENDVDADVEVVFTRVLRHLDALNLPRTALNCLTLLLVSGNEAEVIVNRAEVIRGILNIAFQSAASLTYRSRADLKDCEHLLGFFCEGIIKSGEDLFTRSDFISSGQKFCSTMLVDVDVPAVLDLLIEYAIVVPFGEKFGFRFSYWIYYFAAARMHHDAGFRGYVFEDMQYTRFPEVVEFYTGIDRCREDALSSLNSDLIKLSTGIGGKVNVSSPSKLFSFFRWNARQFGEEKMLAHLENDVLSSSLPQQVKDDFFDKEYDPARPYDQKIRALLNSYSFDNLAAGIRASARALRNSDYVQPEHKKSLLGTLLLCLEQVQSVLILISPILAKQGRADFEGTDFILDESLRSEDGSTSQVWNVIPFNVIQWYKADLSSAKMGPLLFEKLRSELDPLRRHNIALLVAAIKPKSWKRVLEDYALSLDKDSFYLYDLFTYLVWEYRYEYLDDKTRDAVSALAKAMFSKHIHNTDKPSANMLSKINLGEAGESA